jgi:hypothetical protein
MAGELKPYSRGEYNRALVLNALFDPFATVLFATVLMAGLLLGRLAILAPIAIVVYLAAAARTYFDEDEANKVLERERGKHRKDLESGVGKLDLATLSDPIANLVRAAIERQVRIRQAIEGADLPYEDAIAEVDAFVLAMEATARRAQLLYETLDQTPPNGVEARLAEVRAANDPARAQLVDALANQLSVLRRCETQLQGFYDQMEQILVELDTIRGNLVSASASTDSASQKQLAEDVRGLREEVGALAEGLQEAYEEPREGT